MQYKIVFDTSALYNDKELKKVFNSTILDIKKFLEKNEVENVELILPEIVIEERIQQKHEEALKLLNGHNDSVGQLDAIGVKIPPITMKASYYDEIKLMADEFIKTQSLTVLPMPSLDTKQLASRAIKKAKPFNDKGAGFKDTLIFLSLVQFAQSQQKKHEYVFVTRNYKDFDNDVINSFKELTGYDLTILHDVEKLKSYLDEHVPLGLHLEKLHEQVKQAVMQKTGTITAMLNGKLSEGAGGALGTYDPYITSALLTRQKNVGYDFKDLNVENISSIDEGYFKVEGKIRVKKLGQRDPYPTSATKWSWSVSGSDYEELEIFNFSLEFDKNTGMISECEFRTALVY